VKGYIGKRKWTGFWRTTKKEHLHTEGWITPTMLRAIIPVGKRRAKIMKRMMEKANG